MPEWISVKDRLPKHKGDYLVYWKWESLQDWSSDNIEIVYFRGKTQWAKRNNDITHWMPLPEKPN